MQIASSRTSAQHADALGPVVAEQVMQQLVPVAHDSSASSTRLQRLGWALARLAFHSYVAFSLFTVVGGFLTAPLMTKLFFGDWRFWRFLRPGTKLFRHGWCLLVVVLRGEGTFMLGVSLTSAPQSEPQRALTELSASWSHGTSCGTCRRCCHVKELCCPVLDTDSGFCRGYNAFYWRYFNCGRYPSSQAEIDYYGCPKWQMSNTTRPVLMKLTLRTHAAIAAAAIT